MIESWAQEPLPTCGGRIRFRPAQSLNLPYHCISAYSIHDLLLYPKYCMAEIAHIDDMEVRYTLMISKCFALPPQILPVSLLLLLFRRFVRCIPVAVYPTWPIGLFELFNILDPSSDCTTAVISSGLNSNL